ncbi:hypothetical protein B0H19DRAFT_1245499 [Mycena capillaripes]|nr:hypothetical protein B0H19DRAFT_1245499 [Mycena capillaripes]
MKDLNTPTSAVPRSATLSRFRPISLPVYLDYKVVPKRRPGPPADLPPASPASPQRPSPTTTKHTAVSGGFQISSIPRILRPAGRTPLLSKVHPQLPPAAYPYPRANESRCCQMLIHGLFIAFEEDHISGDMTRSEPLRADGGRDFTHLISLSTRHKSPIKQTVDRTTGAKRLKLHLPRLYSPIPPTQDEIDAKVAAACEAAAAQGIMLSQDDYYDIVFDEGEGSGYTGLEALQLLAAREFLLASGLSADSKSVRVLVTTPRDHRTDAIAVVMGYLSLVLGCRVKTILKLQDDHKHVLDIWKKTISEDCAEFIEEVCNL